MKLWKYFVVNRNKKYSYFAFVSSWWVATKFGSLGRAICWTPTLRIQVLRMMTYQEVRERTQTSAGQFLQNDQLDRPEISKPRRVWVRNAFVVLRCLRFTDRLLLQFYEFILADLYFRQNCDWCAARFGNDGHIRLPSPSCLPPPANTSSCTTKWSCFQMQKAAQECRLYLLQQLFPRPSLKLGDFSWVHLSIP